MKYPRDPRESRLLTVFALLFFFVPQSATAQEKPNPKRNTPQTAANELTPSADSQKDPVDEHYRAAETFQLAGDLNSAEVEYRHVISLGLQRIAAVGVLEHDTTRAIVYLQSAAQADPSDQAAQMALASV